MPIQRAAVIGAGTMGSEIAYVIAAAGVSVWLKDIDETALARGLAHAHAVFDRQVSRGRLSAAEAERLRALIQPTANYADLAAAEFVIEAVPERLERKQQVFAELEAVVADSAILASNTSSIPLSDISQGLRRRERVVGFHFFNPAAVMRLVEVIQPPAASEEAIATALAFARQIGKTPVRVKECPGFLVNRILLAGMLEAFRYQEETNATLEAVDAVLKQDAGVPMGPFALADLLGLDVVLDVVEILARAYGECFAPTRLLRERVAAGRLGDKTGAGFYPDEAAVRSPLSDPAQLVQRFQGIQLIEACRCLEEGIASAADIDLAMRTGAGLPAGPLAWADARGLDEVLAMLERLAGQLGARFTPPVSLRERVAAGQLGQRTGQGFHDYRLVRLAIEPPIAHLTINHPPANALSPAVLAELEAAVRTVEADERVRTVIITGEGRMFVAGADITVFAQASPAELEAFIDQGNTVLQAIEQSRKIYLAAINGACLGGGLELALACDLRLAAASARLGQPEINLGLIPGWGGLQRLPRLIGRGRALALCLEGNMISASEAAGWGLVHRVVADEALAETAQSWAHELASRAPLAAAQIKHRLIAGESQPLPDAIAEDARVFTHLLATEDAKEGVAAFLAKRKPSWKGR